MAGALHHACRKGRKNAKADCWHGRSPTLTQDGELMGCQCKLNEARPIWRSLHRNAALSAIEKAYPAFNIMQRSIDDDAIVARFAGNVEEDQHF